MSDTVYQIIGADEVARRLGNLGAAAEDAQRTVLKALGDRYVEVLQEETPVGEGPGAGRLQQSYETEDQAYTETGAHYRITNKTPYLRYVIKGRGPVRVISALSLRFVIGGRVIFRKSVGPAAANDFPPRARARMQPEIDRAGPEIANLIVRSYGR